jgi:hypothetical protein
MFRITDDPSSGSLVQCLAKNYNNDSIVSVGMDKVDVMAVRACTHTHNGSEYAAIAPTFSMPTDTIESFL